MLSTVSSDSVNTPLMPLDRLELAQLLQKKLAPARIHPAAVLWLLGVFGGCERAISPFVDYIKSEYPANRHPIVDLAMLETIQKILKRDQDGTQTTPKVSGAKDGNNIKKLRLQLGRNLALSLCDGAGTPLYDIVVALLRKRESDNKLRELTYDKLKILPGVTGNPTASERLWLVQSRPDIFLTRRVDSGDFVCRLLIRWWEFSPSWW